MDVFNIIILIITIIIIISFILITLYFKNLINNKSNNNNEKINKELEIIKNDIHNNKDNINYLLVKKEHKFNDGYIIFFTTSKENKNKVLDTQTIYTKIYRKIIDNTYSISSTLPFYFKPRLVGDNYIYHIYGICLKDCHTSPYSNLNITYKDNNYNIELIDEKKQNKNMGVVILTDDNKTSINYLQSDDNIFEGELMAKSIYENWDREDRLLKVKYESGYVLMNNDNNTLKLENKKYLMTLKDVYGIYPGAIYYYLNNKNKENTLN